jgi:2-dehydro-3-deoxyphosphogluconate aldolase / (4S)-4-hydroxy-2-oxoglutarate aldolase
MARHRRLETLLRMTSIGIVPVFSHADPEVAFGVVAACADGGATVVEFTNRADRALGVFRRLEERTAAALPGVILGVGSIVDAPTAAQFVGAGASFVVGPLLDEKTARFCNGRKIPYLPGCATATEIHRAHLLGAEIVKIFPGDVAGGPAFVRALRAPCPWADLMPTGGVEPTRESLRAWFSAGIACAGIGSNLVTKELVAARNWATLTRKVREAVETVAEIRAELGAKG